MIEDMEPSTTDWDLWEDFNTSYHNSFYSSYFSSTETPQLTVGGDTKDNDSTDILFLIAFFGTFSFIVVLGLTAFQCWRLTSSIKISDDKMLKRIELREKRLQSMKLHRQYSQKNLKNNNIYNNDNNNNDGMIERVPTIIEEPEPLPYKLNNLRSYASYLFQTWIAVNPRLLSLWLLYRSLWPRALVIVDLVTDIIVTKQLFNRDEHILFTISCLILIFPFIVVWTVSLRFIQKYIGSNTIKNNNNNNQSSKNGKQKGKNNKGGSLGAKFSQFQAKYGKKITQILIMLYIFPPIGCLIVTCYEVSWVFYDVMLGMKSFINGTILIIDKDKDVTSMKSFRKVIEFFGESIPQTALQTYMFISGTRVDTADLVLSFSISLFNLVYNSYKLRKEAKFHGMSFAEYSISVLQLADVPIVKLVPRLPAIQSGKVKNVNFNDFVIDKQSLGPIIEALSDRMCKLKVLRVSVGSLHLLDYESCRMLGNFLKRRNIEAKVSQTVKTSNILEMFKQLDSDNNGYLDINEFSEAFDSLVTNITEINKNSKNNRGYASVYGREMIKNEYFERLAIRTHERDRIYFIDFYNHLTAYDTSDKYGNIAIK